MSVPKRSSPTHLKFPLLAGVTAFALLAAGFACSSPKKSGQPGNSAGAGGPSSAESAAGSPSSLEPAPWTDAFSESTALLAADVHIEGPPGLISHVASVSNPEELDRTEKTVPEGFLQLISVKPQAHGANIKAQLDRLAIVAMERLTILERPRATTVVVTAKGDVYWENPSTHEVKRGETLRFEGKIGEKPRR